MRPKPRQIDSLTAADLRAHPIWEFVSNDEPDETFIRPFEGSNLTTLTGRLVAVEAQLAAGARVWALGGNIDLRDAQRTRHFLTLSLLSRESWFHLARYHDIDYHERGPAAAAHHLGLPIHEVFPIRYDIAAWVAGDPETIRGVVEAEPRDRLSRAALIALAVP